MSAIKQLIGQHRHCDDEFVMVEQAVRHADWSQATPLFHQFEQEMEHHFTLEEQKIFPAFEAVTGFIQGPTVMMRHEHAQMRELMQYMQQALLAQDASRYLGQADTLLILMQQHNMKEENILYPMCEQHIDNLEQIVSIENSV